MGRLLAVAFLATTLAACSGSVAIQGELPVKGSEAWPLAIPMAGSVRVLALNDMGMAVSAGSGVVISATRVVTARHMISEDVVRFKVRSISGHEVLAKAVVSGTEGMADWATLECEDSIGIPVEMAPRGLVPEPLSPIVAIGYAVGLLDPTVTFGHVQPHGGGLYRISAPIAPGNSGGGTFLLYRGRPVLIGLTVGVYTSRGSLLTHMALVVPLDMIRDGGGL